MMAFRTTITENNFYKVSRVSYPAIGRLTVPVVGIGIPTYNLFYLSVKHSVISKR